MTNIFLDIKRRNIKQSIVMFFSLFLLLFLIFISLTLGVIDVSINDFLFRTITEDTKAIIYNIRMPRVIVSCLVGMNLAMSGAIMQGVLKNPIASPSTLGVTAGAGLGALIILILYPNQIMYIPIVAFIGAIMVLLVVSLLSYKNNYLQPIRLILAGVAIATLCNGITTGLMVFHSDKVQGAMQWMAGSFQGRSWAHIRMLAPYTLIGFIGVLFSGRSLNILALGDDTATSLGLNVKYVRIMLMVIAGFLTASAVSVAGLLGFVGLVVPHIVRLLVGSDYEILLPTTAVIGACLVVVADTVARVIIQPTEIPVGVFMSFLGAPFFLYLLRKKGV